MLNYTTDLYIVQYREEGKTETRFKEFVDEKSALDSALDLFKQGYLVSIVRKSYAIDWWK